MSNQFKVSGFVFAALLGISAAYLGLFYKNKSMWLVFSSNSVRTVGSGELAKVDILAATIFAGDPGAAEFRFLKWAQDEQDKTDQFFAQGTAVLIVCLAFAVAVLTIKHDTFGDMIERFRRHRKMSVFSSAAVCLAGLILGGYLLLKPSLPEAVSTCAGTKNQYVSLADLGNSCSLILRYGNPPKALADLARAKLAYVKGLGH